MLLFHSDYDESWCKKNDAPKEDEAEINRKITGCMDMQDGKSCTKSMTIL